MILKFCDDNFLFYITHTKYFDILCLFVILFFIILFFLVQKDEFLKKFKNNNFKQFLVILSLGLFTGFFVFLFVWLLNANTFNGCTTKYYENKYYEAIKNVSVKTDLIGKTKIIVVGDSRMELINNDKTIKKPFNLEIIAKSGTHLDWFTDTASKKIKKIINDDFKYNVIINMGVNDLNWLKKDYDEEDLTEDYFKAYEELVSEYSDVNFYLLSVNPLNEKIIKEKIPDNKRSNKSIKKYNNYLREEIENSKFDNISYCDSYNTLDFETYDGLHYNRKPSEAILNYIINDCVQF